MNDGAVLNMWQIKEIERFTEISGILDSLLIRRMHYTLLHLHQSNMRIFLFENGQITGPSILLRWKCPTIEWTQMFHVIMGPDCTFTYIYHANFHTSFTCYIHCFAIFHINSWLLMVNDNREKNNSFVVWAILCRISKSPIEIWHKASYPYTERCVSYS